MGMHVLIVDDSATMRSILKKVVSLSGYDVSGYLECGNGAEALDVLSRHWVDVILLDIHMPVMDGITLLHHLKDRELLRSIPVILITTEAREEVIEEVLDLGVRAHVKKPFTPERIRQVLTEVMGEEYARQDEEGLVGSDF